MPVHQTSLKLYSQWSFVSHSVDNLDQGTVRYNNVQVKQFSLKLYSQWSFVSHSVDNWDQGTVGIIMYK